MRRRDMMKSREVSIFTAAAILMAVLCFSGNLSAYSGGTGEPNDPYQIANAADLLALAADTCDYDKHFILTADINLASSGSFTTAVIARDTDNSDFDFEGTAFSGVFNGAGHKITNLTIFAGGYRNGNDYLGLFGCISGKIKNLGLENVAVTGGDYSHCYGGGVLGGLVGENDGDISGCYSTGAVTGGYESFALGGLVGYNDANISGCYSIVTVKGGNALESLGGLAGENGGNINNCYSTGAVTAGKNSSTIGGLVGDNCGLGEGATISNCYSTGTVTNGSGSGGGLVGDNCGNISSHCYFLITSGSNNGYGKPLTDANMKKQSSFVGWDFVWETVNGPNDIWAICEGVSYPKLKWQILPGDIICPDGVDFEDLAELCGQWLFEEIPADLAPPPSGNGIVDFADFAVFANQWGTTNNIDELLNFTGQWLKTGLPVCSADISPLPGGDGRVNFADFAAMSNHWLEGL